MPDPKTNEWLHEERWLLRVTLEQQAKSLASRCHAAPSRPSQPTTIVNGYRLDVHAPWMAGSGGNTTGSSLDHPWTRGAKPRQEQRCDPSPRRLPVRNRIDDDHDVCYTIEARRHAQV